MTDMTVYTVDMYSEGKPVWYAYRIFDSLEAARGLIEAFERYFLAVGRREAEGFKDVTFEYRTRTVYSSPAEACAVPKEYCS